MTDKQELLKNSEIEELSNELTYRRYLMNTGKIGKLFQNMTIPEYIALHTIEMESRKSSIYSGRTYLKDLSERMQLTIRQISKMVGRLKERGLVTWSHDGDGSEGTYVMITEAGEKLLLEQEEILKKYYEKVIEKFGKQNLIGLLRLMKQLETVMNGEIEEIEKTELNDEMDGIDE